VAGAVWRGGDGGAFYRGGEAVEGRGDGWPSGGQRCAIKAPVTRRGDDGAATIHGEIEEESVAHWFSSIRVRKGVHRQQAERQHHPRVAAWPSAEGGRRPGGLELGRVHWAQRPTGPVSVGDRKNGGGPHEGMAEIKE
jgi:hypothetical protein